MLFFLNKFLQKILLVTLAATHVRPASLFPCRHIPHEGWRREPTANERKGNSLTCSDTFRTTTEYEVSPGLPDTKSDKLLQGVVYRFYCMAKCKKMLNQVSYGCDNLQSTVIVIMRSHAAVKRRPAHAGLSYTNL